MMCLFARETRRPIEAHEENEPMTRRSEGGWWGAEGSILIFLFFYLQHYTSSANEKRKRRIVRQTENCTSLTHCVSLSIFCTRSPLPVCRFFRLLSFAPVLH